MRNRIFVISLLSTFALLWATAGVPAQAQHSAVPKAPTLTWTTRASLPVGRYDFGLAASQGQIYVIGGDTYRGALENLVWAYDPATSVWTRRADLPTSRIRLGAATASNGKIYAIGGSLTAISGAVEEYDPSTNTWTGMASMPTPRVYPGVVTGANGKIYVVGGSTSSGITAIVEEYNPSTNIWASRTSAIRATQDPCIASASNGKIYAIGGTNDRTTVQEYDPLSNTWALRTSMPTSRLGMDCAFAPDGKIYVIGGVTNSGQHTGKVEAYDPQQDVWSSTSDLPSPRSGLGVVALNNTLYAIGGWGPNGTSSGPLAIVEAATIPSSGSIIGHIATQSGGNLADVTITAALGANRYSTTTTSEGIFAFDNLPLGNYIVTPVKAGYQFTPASRTVTVPSFDALFVEFAAQGDSCGGSVAAVDVMLVIDRSGSMGGQPIADEKLAAKTFVDQMSLSCDQVGLASFADSASLDRQLTRDGYSVKVGIDSLVASGQTNMSAAINVAQTELRSSRHNTAARPVMIFMSDGQPNVDSGPAAIAAAQAAKSTGTRIFAVGLGSVDDSLMRQLASSATDYFYTPTSADLTRIYQNIAVVMNCAQAKVKVNPASKRVSLSGGAFTIDIVAQDITNMGAYQTELTFNALTLQAVSVTPGAFLGSTGRSVSPVGPVIDNNLGRITFGAFTFGTQPGVNGTGTLATITFSPRAKGTSTLHLQNLQVANPASTMLSAIPVDGQVEVAGCFGDFDGDNDVDIFDLQLAASHWNCRTGNTCYDAQFDAEPDGDIDVFDLQRFAAAWGSRCTTATQQSSLLDRPRPELTMADAVSLKLLPETPSVAPGHTFTVTVNIQNAVSVGTFQTDLVYDPTIVQVEAVTVGPFLSSSGRSVSSVGPAIDNSIGRVAFGAFTFGTAPGNSGGGDLAYVRLRAQGLGQTTLNFQQTGIGDTQGNPQYLGNLAGSSVTVSNQPQHRAYLPLTLRR